jgi:phosphate starvation-inducible PhoH-like protein
LKRSNKANPREDRNLHNKQARDNISDLDPCNTNMKNKVALIPKNLNQETYVEKLEDPNTNILFAVGPAGCGKTMFATYAGIQAYKSGLFKKIIITRPAVSVDEQHGFLPGTLIEKMQPWVLPILDYFHEFYSKKQVLDMVESGVIDIVPLAYMRGRTFHHSWIIGDEFQNTTPNQMKMLLTRIGTNSKIVVTGDIQQHDRGFEVNGLKDVIQRLKNRPGIELCEFSSRDVERNPIIETILEMYQD